ncbi:DUF2292 domain-containing protein [Enterococcus sp. AZ196]|uniref:DUF2292 domain-containing protein n=1 Tax=Enterococcus sp. AZ196 TaxID=2774659 RepID=UPI003D268847
MDKVYIDNNQKAEVVELPKYGEIKLIVKDGQVVQYYKTESHQLTEKQPEK